MVMKNMAVLSVGFRGLLLLGIALGGGVAVAQAAGDGAVQPPRPASTPEPGGDATEATGGEVTGGPASASAPGSEAQREKPQMSASNCLDPRLMTSCDFAREMEASDWIFARPMLAVGLTFGRRSVGETSGGAFGLALEYGLWTEHLELMLTASAYRAGGGLQLPVGLSARLAFTDHILTIGGGVGRFVYGGDGRPGHEDGALSGHQYWSLRAGAMLFLLHVNVEYIRELRHHAADTWQGKGRSANHLMFTLGMNISILRMLSGHDDFSRRPGHQAR